MVAVVLLQAVAENHRRWFRARGGSNGIWTVGREDGLGVRLVARGWEWGWRPHWMGVELDEEPPSHADLAAQSGFKIAPAGPPFAKTLPYHDDAPLPEGATHLGVRLREKVIGQVVVFPLDGVAGIYSMGVAPKVQGRGIGLALTRAALRTAWEQGCRAAVLNATDAGERLYVRAGFKSLGWGQTWWPARGAAPTERQTAIAEAAGFGDIPALEALGPSEPELAGLPRAAGAAPTGTSPLALAALVGQAASLDFALTRFPSLAATRFRPHGGNLLHLAVEHDRPEVVATALRLGVDPEARDASFDAPPAGWAEHLGRDHLRPLFLMDA
jgi:GNAT superfamily N-acetyltransferase